MCAISAPSPKCIRDEFHLAAAIGFALNAFDERLIELAAQGRRAGAA